MKVDDKNYMMLVCAHKPDFVRNDDFFRPIQVGKSLSDLDLGFTGDDVGENISHKNKNYCELTALYWAWKNLKDVDYIGLSHYRRYFDLEDPKGHAVKLVTTEELKNWKYDTHKYARILSKYDIILPKPRISHISVENEYCRFHVSDDFRTLQETVHDLHPDYDKAFFDVLCNSNKLRNLNMMFCSWRIFDDYCTWLFSILEEVEKRIDISNYNPVQARIFGYMAERLLNVYFHKNKFKIYSAPIVWGSDNPRDWQVMRSSIKQKIWNLRCNLAFFLVKSRNPV